MPQWEGSDRRSRLPSDWPVRRKRVLRRDGFRCTALSSQGERCAEPASDVDHVRPGDDHSEGNLRSLCAWHHLRKSGGEGARALAAKRRRIDKTFRRTESHPGAID
jgi:5-methylcytosine-specific restriction endonuclease McrA